MSIDSYRHLHGYCNAVEFRHMFTGADGKTPMVFFACTWHGFMSQSQESRGDQECVEGLVSQWVHLHLKCLWKQ